MKEKRLFKYLNLMDKKKRVVRMVAKSEIGGEEERMDESNDRSIGSIHP